jgi:stress-induced morphogen
MDAQTVESLILTAIPDAKVSVEDPRGDGAHYAATIAAPSFAGKTRLQQHRMVHSALKSLGDKITVSITTVAA